MRSTRVADLADQAGGLRRGDRRDGRLLFQQQHVGLAGLGQAVRDGAADGAAADDDDFSLLRFAGHQCCDQEPEYGFESASETTAAAILGKLTAQCYQLLQAPPHERVDVVLFVRRKGPGHVVRRVHALLRLLAQLPILFGGELPERHDVFQPVVAAFDGVLRRRARSRAPRALHDRPAATAWSRRDRSSRGATCWAACESAACRRRRRCSRPSAARPAGRPSFR